MNVPGPAKYNLLKTYGFGQDSVKFSINPGKKDGRKKTDAEITPGPGTYETMDNCNGVYPVSSLRSTVKNLWSSSKVERFRNTSKIFYY